MQLSFYVAFVVVGSVCVKLATGYSPVEVQGYDNGHVGKKGTSSRYADYDNRIGDPSPSCTMEADYEISQNYIIRTKDSKANGGNFVAALSVRTFDVCLEQCCLKENCDTTIFVGEAYRSEETNCFLFECRPDGKGGENRCLFTYHLGYISSMKKSLGGFQGYAPDPDPVTTAIPVQQIETTTKPTPPPNLAPVEPVSNCPVGYFECNSGQCINELYICNSVVDCDDGSDEYRCSAQDPAPGDQTNPGEDLQTDDQKLPQSLLMPPTNPPNMPNKYSNDAVPGRDESASLKGEADQTLADQLNDQSPLEDGNRGESTIQDTNQEDRERALSDMKTRLQDESGGRLPQVLGNPDKDRDQDPLPELECHGATCYEIPPDGGKTRFGDVLDKGEEDEVEGGRGEDKETPKSKSQNQQKSPVDTQPRNLEREEYQTGDLRDDDYQPPQKAKVPDYKEDSTKFVYDKNTGEYREDEGDGNSRYDVKSRLDDENEQKENREREDRYEVNKHLSDVEDRDASQHRDMDYDPIDRKMVSDHDMGMKHPADVESIRNDPYRDQDLDRQDSPPLQDGTKSWGFPDKSPKSRPPTQPPVRQGVSHSEPRLGVGYGYNSDYYSYYYPPYGQTRERFKAQQTQNNNLPSNRNRQDSYSGRTSQGASYYQSKNNPYRVHGTQIDNTNRYDTNSDVYGNSRRYQKVSDIPADNREEKYPSNDARIRPGYNIPDPVDKDGAQPEAAVTVMAAPPHVAVTDGEVHLEDAGKVNDTNILTEEGNANTVEMVYESRGGSGMPPASSAILPLVIGLVITVCLLLMVGCRLRYMNQRLRYGRLKTSAHDADYLINGMYL